MTSSPYPLTDSSDAQSTDSRIDDIIIDQWGLGDLEPEKQQEILAKIEIMLFKASVMRGLELLSDGEEKELEQKLAGHPEDEHPEVTMAFFVERIPDFPSIIAEESQKIHNVIVDKS